MSIDDKGYLHVTNDSIIWTIVNEIKELYFKTSDHNEQISIQARQIASKTDNEALYSIKAEADAKIKKLEKIIINK